jgi:hypothetical protein
MTTFIKENAADKMPILVFGGFNVNGRMSDEYKVFDSEFVVDNFIRRDLLFDKFSGHPVTYLPAGSGNEIGKSVDYVFFFRPNGDEQPFKNMEVRLRESFGTSDPPLKLSSHHGIETFIELAGDES